MRRALRAASFRKSLHLLKLVTASFAMVASPMAMPAFARMLSPDQPADAVEIMKRTQCGEKDGASAIFHWRGKVYSHVEGEPDRLLFTGEGMNIRQCVAVTDPKRGTGYRQVSRELMVFTDPKSGEVVREWANPWTGESVPVMHIANDPVNVPAIFPKGADGRPFKLGHHLMGPWIAIPLEIPLFYKNPLAGDYQDFVGGKYHAMEIFDFIAPVSSLLDTRVKMVQPSVSWVRISDWMPWMRMRGRTGKLIFNAVGTKVDNFEALPDVLKREIRTSYPSYTAPPPVDDARPNETTWTVFKKWHDSAQDKRESEGNKH